MKKLLVNRKILFPIIFPILFIAPINPQANVYVDPVSITLSGQTSVTFNFYISNVVNLHSYSIDIYFDDSIIDFQQVTGGTFLSKNSSYSTFLGTQPSANRITNSFSVDEAILGGGLTVSGSGKLFSVTFQIISAGTSSINITDTELRDQFNNEISSTSSSGEVKVPISINTRVFLQGSFYSNSMTTYLNTQGVIPLHQPYNTVPWNYAGTESVSSGFFTNHPNIVDWILVELRSGTSVNTLVDRKAGFITSSGEVVGIDGNSLLYLMQPKNNYYIVIYHRNHLSIMSSVNTQLDYISTLYNYTDSQTKAYGNNSMIDLGNGFFGMIAGDANGNGQVQNNDSESIWKLEYGQAGYNNGDFNLNGQVQNNDRETYWRSNFGKGSQVPHN